VTALPVRSVAALDPVREALFEDAHRRAAELLRAAQEQAATLRSAALHKADTLRAEAVAEGEREARAAAALRSARVRRLAHETVLAQRSALRLELQREVARSAAALRTDPRYPELMAGLAERSRTLLGADAEVSPSPAGGVVARSGSRRLDLSLPTLAAATLELMTPEVGALWSSMDGVPAGGSPTGGTP
jgi:hypothetical protein